MRGQKSVFCQFYSSRNSHHASTDWLQYPINLVTIVPVNFQQKINLALNNQLEPQCVPGFSACTQYAKGCLFYFVSNFSRNIFNRGNPILRRSANISEMNITIIVIFSIYIIYLLKCFSAIPII